MPKSTAHNGLKNQEIFVIGMLIPGLELDAGTKLISPESALFLFFESIL
jgi:hypothetical protein